MGPLGEGAVWEFGSLVDRGTLNPRSLTGVKHLRFEVEGLGRYQSLTPTTSLAGLKVKVFATSVPH